ncbi:5118_t:CDS:2, partial [Acaulospora morrowiae]
MVQVEEALPTTRPIKDCEAVITDLDFIFSLDTKDSRSVKNRLPAELSLGQLRAVTQVAVNIFAANHEICSKKVQEYLSTHPEYKQEFTNSVQDMMKELLSMVPQEQNNGNSEKESLLLASQEAFELTQKLSSSLESLIDKTLDGSHQSNVTSSTIKNGNSENKGDGSDKKKRKRFSTVEKNNHYSDTGKKQRINMLTGDPRSINFVDYFDSLREDMDSMISIDQSMKILYGALHWPITDSYILSERFQAFRERMHLPDPLPITHPVIHEIACCGYKKNKHDWKRYEWIGDRFLLVAISWHGVTRYPDCRLLNHVINFMVSNRVFIPFCLILGLHESNGILKGCNQKEYANAFEAYFCGLYLEYGEKKAREYASKLLGGLFHNIVMFINDYKDSGGDESVIWKDFDLVLKAYFGID